jgi:hypothetical protein
MESDLRTTSKIVSAIGFTIQIFALIFGVVYPDFNRLLSQLIFSFGLALVLLGVWLILKYNRQNKVEPSQNISPPP